MVPQSAGLHLARGDQCSRGRVVPDLQMELTETIVALGACGGLLAAAVVLDRRPYRPGRLNYIPLMIICLAACLVLVRHLLTLIRPG
jgi:hypothetical protein